METRDEVIRELAELIQGLQVPASLHSVALVVAGPHYDRVRNLIGDFGWSDADQIEVRLRKVLDNGLS